MRRLSSLNGGLAQLGEHLLCKQGVVGSIPSSSTNSGTGIQKSGIRVSCSADQVVPISVNRKQWGLVALVLTLYA